MLYDISQTLRPGIPVWPGDTELSIAWPASFERGDPVRVSALTTTPHAGTHADAPAHTEPAGDGIGELSLEPFLGRCRVVAVPPAARIEPRHLERLDLGSTPRLLLRTGSVTDRRTFPRRFSTLSPELARALAAAGVLLVGLDTPSVDPLEEGEGDGLAAHHALARGGVAILEGLVLDAVPDGEYELIALPLRIAGLDGSPVRAVLRTL